MSSPAEQQGQGGVPELQYVPHADLFVAIGTISAAHAGERASFAPDTEPTTPPGGGPSKKLF